MTHALVETSNLTGYAQVVEELTTTANQAPATATVQRSYAYGLQRLSQRQLINGIWRTSYYGYDGHGSVRFLTDENGAITDNYDY